MSLFRLKPAEMSAHKTVVRLSPDQLMEVRRKVGGQASTFVSQNTTDIQAGFMLGVNHVLNILQEGFTIETP